MSGISLAVAPRSDPDHGSERQPTVMLGGVMGSLRVIELQLVAFIMVFSASGLVPLIDLVFPVATTIYLLAISRRCTPSSTPPARPPRPRRSSAAATLATSIVIVTKVTNLEQAVPGVRGAGHDGGSVPAAGARAGRILTENVVGSLGAFSPPVRALVPLLYTVRRVFVIVDWVYDVWANRALTRAATAQEAVWMWFGRYLAAANLLYFSANLFVFLIPRFLPRAFEKYFRMRDEVCAKTAEDKHARGHQSSVRRSRTCPRRRTESSRLSHVVRGL
ncbi:unnamed protein product [Miscanthus lutarioriparius]|uniref:DUF7733 domain-containing protein n=1 Tax=Miscanthus lutarioriparius TaxID=422564 RepID=A0A811QW10_9POAL|nr:unnamed protein product [Miscanthus lutarioriparius]